MEINGLKKAFTQLYQKRKKSLSQISHCGIGAVKINIGHLETATGIASVIKVLLALKYQNGLRDAEEALQSEGLTPINLSYKEGLALVNGTASMTGFAAFTIFGAKKLLISHALVLHLLLKFLVVLMLHLIWISIKSNRILDK